MLAAAQPFVGGDHRDRAAIGDAAGEALGRKAAEHHGMNGADPRTGEHCRRGLGDHRHIDHHPVAAPDPALEQEVGEAAGLVEQFAIADVAAGAGFIGFENQRGLVAMVGDVAVEAIDRQIELTILVPFDPEIGLGERTIAGFFGKDVPRQPARLVEPEAVRIGAFKVVQLGQFERADAGVEIVRDGMHGWIQRPRLMSITKR